MSYKTQNQLNRRSVLQLGGGAVAGLGLSRLLEAQALSAQGGSTPDTSVILVWLPGGPSHMETYDLKPDAPSAYRGEFRPIATTVPGLDLCEHLPRHARCADKFTVIRSIVDSMGQHSAYQCETGHTNRPTEPAGGWPSMGSSFSFLGRSSLGTEFNRPRV